MPDTVTVTTRKSWFSRIMGALIPPTSTLVLITPVPEETPEPARYSLPLWQIIGLLGLFMVIASASVVDPRPKALKRLGETFWIMSSSAKDNSIENK